ncbi:hypothetical protein FA95DRAFT_1466625, partial [Auriscalpium vulgare]
VPRLKYEQQSMKHWIARLLTRPRLEAHLREAFRRPPKTPMEDIWDGDWLHRILDPKGKPFLPGPKKEIRLVFSFSVDGFNPFHMKQAKQKVSSTGLWMVCLNLPPHLCFLPENMFLVGVLPTKPALDEMNHSL